MLQKIYTRLLALALVVSMISACNDSNGANADKENGDTTAVTADDGFTQIFDGKSLEGWDGDTTYWRVENGTVIGEISDKTPQLKTNTFLIWRGGQPGDFEFKAEYRISKEGNSGVNYRSEEVPDVKYALRGYQADIDGANTYTGQNYEERKRTTLAYRGQTVTIPATNVALETGVKDNAWNPAKVTASLDKDSLKAGMKPEDWNEIHLVIKGNHLQHYINDVLMSDVTDNDTVNGKMKGLIGLQVHVMPKMKVEYRNIRLKQE